MTPERWQQVNEVFHSALKHGPAERAAYLDQVCDGDQELRKEVESLIALHESDSDGLIEPYPFEAAAHLLAEDKADLNADQRIGQYKVLSLLGRGGMGEVYLAYDSKLGRKVALKVLPSRFTQDQDRVRRFEQEARAASALNHPNILTIFDIEKIEGTHFIATEYIEGRTLRQRMADGKMDLTESLDLATQIASALSAAHQAGIAHRDIKPENIMLRPDGYAKVLDFGLAKLAERTVEDGDTGSQAVTAVTTETGVVIGTTSYMSPEQAMGRHLDQRSDVFSFGTVFYEMLSGMHAFRRDSDIDTLHAIVHDEPPGLRDAGANVPIEVQRVLRRCLEKDPDKRYANASELSAALKDIKSSTTTGAGVRGYTKLALFRHRQKWSMVLSIFVLLIALFLLFWRFKINNQPRTSYGAQLADMRTIKFTAGRNRARGARFSPDGKQIAFFSDNLAFSSVNEANEFCNIYIKLVDGGAQKQLTNNLGFDVSAVWSPDSQYLAFSRLVGNKRAIVTIPVLGSPERRLLTTTLTTRDGLNAAIDWSPQGDSIAYSDARTTGDPLAISLLAVATLEAHPLTSPPDKIFGDTQPIFSPDGQTVAFVRFLRPRVGDVYVIPSAGGEARRLTFDNKDIQGLTWTPDGHSIVVGSTRGGPIGLWRISDLGGEPEPVGVAGEQALLPTFSRQDQRLAYTTSSEASSMWRVDLSPASRRAGRPVSLSRTAAWEGLPEISSDANRITFSSSRSGAPEVWVCDSDGSNPQQLTRLGNPSGTPSWSPDGQFIAFDVLLKEKKAIYVLNVNGGPPRQVTDNPGDDQWPSWSRDGRWIYFVSNRSGDSQLWKVHPEGGEAIKVTSNGGSRGWESTDCTYVYYERSPNVRGLWRMRVDGGDEQLALEKVPADSWHEWAVTDEGIYFVEPMKNNHVIEFYNLATRRLTQLATATYITGLTVSKDGRFLVYTQLDAEDLNIVLVENYR